jgi:hypothetical protein
LQHERRSCGALGWLAARTPIAQREILTAWRARRSCGALGPPRDANPPSRAARSAARSAVTVSTFAQRPERSALVERVARRAGA